LHAGKGAAAAGHGLTVAELSEDYLFPHSRSVMKLLASERHGAHLAPSALMDGKVNEVLFACRKKICKASQPELTLSEGLPGTFKAIFGG